MHLKFFLEDLLGSPVDLVTAGPSGPKSESGYREAQYVEGISALS